MLVNFGESHYCSRVFMKTVKFMDTIGLASPFRKLFLDPGIVESCNFWMPNIRKYCFEDSAKTIWLESKIPRKMSSRILESWNDGILDSKYKKIDVSSLFTYFGDQGSQGSKKESLELLDSF